MLDKPDDAEALKIKADRERFAKIDKIETSPVVITNNHTASIPSAPDLRSPDERNENWHRPPEDLREERKGTKDN